MQPAEIDGNSFSAVNVENTANFPNFGEAQIEYLEPDKSCKSPSQNPPEPGRAIPVARDDRPLSYMPTLARLSRHYEKTLKLGFVDHRRTWCPFLHRLDAVPGASLCGICLGAHHDFTV